MSKNIARMDVSRTNAIYMKLPTDYRVGKKREMTNAYIYIYIYMHGD
jgi:hypothetical protein